MSKKLKILLIFDAPYDTARGYDFKHEFAELDWATESDVYQALLANGHDVRLLGIHNNLIPLLEEIKEAKPDLAFNLTEVFKEKPYFDKNIVWLLELLEVPYTGASPENLLVCNDKALSKKILSFHRIHIPHFYTFYRNHRIKLVKRLRLPLIVKPLGEEASRGISQASVVDDEEALAERVKFIHQSMDIDAIAEEYIEGRELYVSVLGGKRAKVLPFREMKFGQLTEGEPRIATYKAKWDLKFREKWGIKNVFAGRLAEGLDKRIADLCRRAYRVLNMQCYARFDVRVTPEGDVYILEANANPCLARYDELGQSAEKAGIPYDKLVQKIINLGLERNHR